MLFTDLHFVRNEDKLVLEWISLIHDLFASRKVLEIRAPIQSLLYLLPPSISSFILLFDGCPLDRFSIYLSIVLSFLLPRLLLFYPKSTHTAPVNEFITYIVFLRISFWLLIRHTLSLTNGIYRWQFYMSTFFWNVIPLLLFFIYVIIFLCNLFY